MSLLIPLAVVLLCISQVASQCVDVFNECVPTNDTCCNALGEDNRCKPVGVRDGVGFNWCCDVGRLRVGRACSEHRSCCSNYCKDNFCADPLGDDECRTEDDSCLRQGDDLPCCIGLRCAHINGPQIDPVARCCDVDLAGKGQNCTVDADCCSDNCKAGLCADEFQPTPSPTLSPTNSPTQPPPTLAPTDAPTSGPTKRPTPGPTPPTARPTLQPTPKPSPRPTANHFPEVSVTDLYVDEDGGDDDPYGLYPPIDCMGVFMGGSSYDACDVCGGDGTSCLDCAGEVFGTAQYDACGVCNGDSSTCGDDEDFVPANRTQ